MQSSTESHLLEPKTEPLPPATALNDRLLSQHTDVPDDDTSCGANLVRNICHVVGLVLTPRQVLGIIRVLKAITFCFLVLNILSNGMYIIFVHVMGTHAVKTMAGGPRDTVIRTYGLGLCLLALAVEVDVSKVVKKFSGLKGFIPRALFMFLIAAITSSHPIYDKSAYQNGQQQGNNYNYDDQQADDANKNGDDANGNDGGDDSTYSIYDPSLEIPSSAVNFQLVTSFVLAMCAAGYLFCGLICLDRFTTRAFLATKDPRVTTAIAPVHLDIPPPGMA